jgi:hypothetical protein
MVSQIKSGELPVNPQKKINASLVELETSINSNSSAVDVVSAALASTVVVLNASVAANASSIAANASAIVVNASAIADNTSAIATNTAKLSSVLVQTVNSQDGAVATGTTAMVFDDSIPQSSEGDQFMSVAITPNSTSNILEIDVVVFGAKNVAAGDMGVALFKDSDTDALAAGFVRLTNNNIGNMVAFRHRMTAPSTSAITFKVRAGANANTFTFNGINAGRIFGGVLASSITIKELTP